MAEQHQQHQQQHQNQVNLSDESPSNAMDSEAAGNEPWGYTKPATGESENETSGPKSSPLAKKASSKNLSGEDGSEIQYQYLIIKEAFQLRNIESVLATGDTLVFIDYDAPQGGRIHDCDGVSWTSKTFRMESEALRRTGSKKLIDMLSRQEQIRIQRRRKVAKSLPEGVKYVLDLTPPAEGDRLVSQITELSLTSGLMNWWKSEIQINNSHIVVGGHDDGCDCAGYVKARNKPGLEPSTVSEFRMHRDYVPLTHKDADISCQLPIHEVPIYREDVGRFVVINTPTYRKIPEYCPVRHRACIARLMLHIAGFDFHFNSAPRVWTMVGVAKDLDCAKILRDPVLQWLLEQDNTFFTERRPEEAARLAFDLELPDIANAAFSVLVNEKALYDAGNPSVPYSAVKKTVFGRRKEDLGEDLDNMSGRVGYAAEALIDRIKELLQKLSRADWWRMFEVPELLKLRQANSLLLLDEVASLKGADEARRHISKIEELIPECTWRYSENYGKELHPSGKDVLALRSPLYDHTVENLPVLFDKPYREFNDLQRALCPFFFTDLWLEVRARGRQDFAGESQTALWTHEEALDKCFTHLFENYPHLGYVYRQRDFNFRDPKDWNSAFNRIMFQEQLENKLKELGHIWMMKRSQWGATWVIVRLAENEIKYLPLWAGGNDDGTGGVFEAVHPPPALGPIGPGPAFHTGTTIASDATSSTGSVTGMIDDLDLNAPTVSSGFVEVMEDLDVESNATVVPGSLDAQDSNATTAYNRGQVVAPSGPSVQSETFSDIDKSMYEDARFEVPAEHQQTGQALAGIVEEDNAEEDNEEEDNEEEDNEEEDDTDSDDDSDMYDAYFDDRY